MMYGFDAAGSGGWLMVVGMVILALVVLGSIWLIVRRPGTGVRSGSVAEEILRARFARGELTSEQFEEASRLLG